MHTFHIGHVLSPATRSAALLGLLAFGCATAPPPQQLRLHEQALPQVWQEAEAWQEAGKRLAGPENTTHVTTSLRDLIRDESDLDELLDLALENNPDLRQTALRLAESRALAHQQSTSRRPEITTSHQTRRQELDAGGGRITTSDHNLSISLSWEADVWGRLADVARASTHDAEAAQADLRAAERSLLAQVMKQWIELAVSSQILATEVERLASLARTEEAIGERFQGGIGQLDDLDATRSSIASTKANVAARRGTLERTVRSLALLVGQTPQTPLPRPATLPRVGLPMVDLPATVIGQRPDLRAAYQRLQAADARTAVAYKDLLPKFSLSASIQGNGVELSDVFRQSPLWSLLGNLTAPIFDSGRLEAQAEQQAHAAERAWWGYRQTLLNALLEVEDGLAWEVELDERERLLAEATRLAESSLDQEQERYHQGLNEIVTLLVAERSAFDARVQWLETRRNRLLRRIDLGLALGLGV